MEHIKSDCFWIEIYRTRLPSAAKHDRGADFFVWLGEYRNPAYGEFCLNSFKTAVWYVKDWWYGNYPEKKYHIVHPVKLPNGFELTGEYRIPEPDELHLDDCGLVTIDSSPVKPALIIWKPNE